MQPKTLAFVITCGPFSTIVRINELVEFFPPANLTLPDGVYNLTTAGGRPFGTITITEGQIDRQIHTVTEWRRLRATVIVALNIGTSTGATPDEFLTPSELFNQTLTTLEEMVDALDGKPCRNCHKQHFPEDVAITAEKLLANFQTYIAGYVQRGVELRVQNLVNGTPELLARAGLTTQAEAEIQLARLRALLAWQPTESSTSSPAP